MAREFSPLSGGHPAIGKPCFICQRAFIAGDVLCLIPIGPGDDEEERAKCDAGLAYNAIAEPVHAECAKRLRPIMKEDIE